MADYSKPDHFTIKAQKEGFPARSVYKLKEIDEKFSLVKPGRSIKALDLGAAPGSWSLYLLRKFAGYKPRPGDKDSSLVSIDLESLSREYDKGLFDKDNFFFIKGDMTSAEIREAIHARGPYGLIVSDAAPLTTGNRSIDTLRSLELTEVVLDYAQNFLLKGGNLVVKVFQGGDTGMILKQIKSLFETGKSFKPMASRPGSFETYYIGLGKKTC